MKDVERDRMITPKQLQEWLACKRTTAYKLLDAGAIPSYKVGRLIRIRQSDVLAFLEQNRYRSE